MSPAAGAVTQRSSSPLGAGLTSGVRDHLARMKNQMRLKSKRGGQLTGGGPPPDAGGRAEQSGRTSPSMQNENARYQKLKLAHVNLQSDYSKASDMLEKSCKAGKTVWSPPSAGPPPLAIRKAL